MGLVSTVIVPPRSRRIFIERPALRALTETIGSSRVTCISAPAGSGKTAAGLFWFDTLKAAGRPGLWVAGRAGVGDLPMFHAALKAAGLAAGLDWEQLDLEGDDAEWHAHLAAAEGPAPILLVDDAQLLSQESLDFLTRLIMSSRDQLTTILVSRGTLALPVARIRSLGLLVEVGEAELRFGPDEAMSLVESAACVLVDSEEMRAIIDDCGGWAAGLVMAGDLYRREKARGVEWKPLSGKLRDEFGAYFEEEVLAHQPQAIRDFLLDTSILAELSPAACAAVTGAAGARPLLDQAYRAGIFLGSVDGAAGRYAYHPLFRAAMRFALEDGDSERSAKLHRRASDFLAGNGDRVAALGHAAATGDMEFLADQLDRLANELIYSGFLYRIDELGSEIPWAIASQRPMLLLALAWRRIRCLSFAAAERFIQAAREVSEARKRGGNLDALEAETLDFMIEHRQIMLDAARDDMVAVEQKAETLLLALGDQHPYLSCTLLAQLMTARRELFHFQDILRLEAETRRALNQPGSDFASIALKSSVAPTLLALGKTSHARQLLEEALDRAADNPLVGAGLPALPALPLAGLLYDIGELDRAAELVRQFLPAARQWGFVDQIANGYLVQARLSFARGDVAVALSVLQEAHLVAIECGLERLRAFAVSEQVCMLLRTSHVTEAERAYLAGGGKLDEEPVPTLNPTRQAECMAVAWLRIEMHQNRLVRARKVAMRWLDFTKRSGAVRSMVTFELLLAEIAVLQGNRSQARRAVRAAIELAEPAGWTQIFVDEGEVIAALLTEAYGDGPMVDTPADVFGAKLAGILGGASLPATTDNEECEDLGLHSRLAAREIDILSMLSGGLRNREIGERLGLTEGTVKWYMQQIYDKLGVRRRPQAVMRARQLGILS